MVIFSYYVDSFCIFTRNTVMKMHIYIFFHWSLIFSMVCMCVCLSSVLLSPSGKYVSVEFHIAQYLVGKTMLEILDLKKQRKADFSQFQICSTLSYNQSPCLVFCCVFMYLCIKGIVYGTGEMPSSTIQHCSCRGFGFGSQHTHDNP